MTSYNAYIGTIPIEKEAFFIELQEIEFFSKYLGVVDKMRSDFAWEVIEKIN